MKLFKLKLLRWYHVSKKLRKEITKSSQLKSIGSRTGKGIDLYKFQKQRNLKEKKKLLNSLSIENDSKPFCETRNLLFKQRNKILENIILSNKEGLILKEIEVARDFILIFKL